MLYLSLGYFCPENKDSWFLRIIDNWLPYLTVLNLEDRSIHTNTLLNNVYISMTIFSCKYSGPMSCGFMAEVCPSLSRKNGISWCLKSASAGGGVGVPVLFCSGRGGGGGGGRWSKPRPGLFTPGKATQQRLDGYQGLYGRVRKTSHRPGFDPRAVQRVASCCTNCGM
jgi:hypothetical protein